MNHHRGANIDLDSGLMVAGAQKRQQTERQSEGQGMAEHGGGPFANDAWSIYTGQYVINSKLTSPVLKAQNAH